MITIHPYQSDWQNSFREIAALLHQKLGNKALRIDHIGSTSIPGLAAKNRIDIQITVSSFSDELITNFHDLGISRHKDIIHDHIPPGADNTSREWEKWLFVMRDGKYDANIHVRIQGRLNQRFAILFRDYLRCHPASAEAYAELKRRLADSLADPDSYADVKDPAVDLIYLAAEEWASFTGWVLGKPEIY